MAWGKSLIALRKIIKNKSIRQLHAWCTPAGSLGLVLKILSKNVNIVIDSFEPHAEAMVENGEWSANGVKNRFLFFMEKLEAKRANNLILATPGMIEYIREKYKVEREKYYVKPACVDLDKFSMNAVKDKDLLTQFNLKDKIVGVYAGKFGGMYLEDETFGFIKSCENYWGAGKFRFIILSSTTEEYIHNKCDEFGISKEVIVKLFVPYNKVEKYIGLADFGICPIKPVPSKKFCTPIKNGEYWALGLPIVIPPNISIDSDIIKEYNAGAVLQSFNETGYLSAIGQIDSILTSKSRMEIYAQIRPVAEKYRNFSIAEKVYTAIYAS
jgi:glycosyltransferase involved in cell wall biosynthesis